MSSSPPDGQAPSIRYRGAGRRRETDDLRQFLDRVRELGELEVLEGANCEWEIGALSHHVAKRSRPPCLLFDRIPGYPAGYRVVSVAFATERRRALTFGFSLAASEESGLELVRKLRSRLKEPLKLRPPVEVRNAPVLENVHVGDDVDLFEFPTPQWQPEDGGRYIGTGDMVIVRDPDEGWINAGSYRVQLHDRSTVTVFADRNHHGDIIRRKYWAKGQACPAVVTCGTHPFLVAAAAFPVPWGTSELDYAGFWLGKPLEVIKGPTTGLPIPAFAEIALEGEMVPPEVETRMEGPFSEFTGHYSPRHPEPAFRVKCVLHRNDPILLGVPPFLGPGVPSVAGTPYYAALTWNKLDEMTPGVQGVWIPEEWGGRATIISLKQHFVGHAKQAAVIALGLRGFLQKYIIVVDDDTDPSDLRQVIFDLNFRAEPEEFDIVRGWKTSMLDPHLSPDKKAAGDFTSSVAIILACRPYHWMKEFPMPIKPSPELEEKVRQKWQGLGT